jgi:hypothetical protein
MPTTDTADQNGNAGMFTNGDTTKAVESPVSTTAPAPVTTGTAAPTQVAKPVSETAPDSAAAKIAAMSDEDRAKAQLESLKKKATLMGLTFSNNIGVEALQAKIAEKTAAAAQEAQAQAVAPKTEQNPLGEIANNDVPLAALPVSEEPPVEVLNARQIMLRDQMRLIRCHIVNLDPKKKDLPGEIFSVANEVLGNVRKFVPYGEVTEGGYHIPFVLYRMLSRRKFLQIRNRRDPRTGTNVTTQAWVKEFSITVMDPLTPDELRNLAQAQIAAGSIDG